MIGPESSRHLLNQSDSKLERVVIWSFAFSRLLCSMPTTITITIRQQCDAVIWLSFLRFKSIQHIHRWNLQQSHSGFFKIFLWFWNDKFHSQVSYSFDLKTIAGAAAIVIIKIVRVPKPRKKTKIKHQRASWWDHISTKSIPKLRAHLIVSTMT